MIREGNRKRTSEWSSGIAGDETGGRKERKSERERGARKKEDVWSESGPRVGEGNWAPGFRSDLSLLTGQLLFAQRHFHHFTRGGTWSQLWLRFCLILTIQAVPFLPAGQYRVVAVRWHLLNSSVPMGLDPFRATGICSYPHHHPT